MADGIVNLSTNTFDETVIGSDKPVIVDFCELNVIDTSNLAIVSEG